MKLELINKTKMYDTEFETIIGIYAIGNDADYEIKYEECLHKQQVKIIFNGNLIMNWCDEVRIV